MNNAQKIFTAYTILFIIIITIEFIAGRKMVATVITGTIIMMLLPQIMIHSPKKYHKKLFLQ